MFNVKDCPRGDSLGSWSCFKRNEFCPAFDLCVATYVLFLLERGDMLWRIRPQLAKQLPKCSDFAILRRIGSVASAHGYQFTWKNVQRAMLESDIISDAESELEMSEVRRAFGVHGRKVGGRFKNMPLGKTGARNVAQDASEGAEA